MIIRFFFAHWLLFVERLFMNHIQTVFKQTKKKNDPTKRRKNKQKSTTEL